MDKLIVAKLKYVICGNECLLNSKEKFKTFDKFPIITKTDVINSRDKFVANDDSSRIVYSNTSGSSGEILKVEWYYKDYLKSISYIWKERIKYGVYPYDKYCTCYSHFYGFDDNIVKPRMKYDKNCLYLSKLYLDDKSLDLYYKEILRFQPKMMSFQPSFAYIFGMFLIKNKLSIPNSLKLLELTGEMLSESVLLELKRMYKNIKITNLYGMQEFNGIGYSNDLKLKILDKNVFVEILDEHGKYCDIGQEGNIIISTLTNSRMPLIKYKSNDRGKWIKINNKKRLVVTNSRSNDFFHYNNLIYDSSLFFTIIASINYEMNYVIKAFHVNHIYNKLEFKLIANNELTKSEIQKERILNKIKEYLDDKSIFIPISIEYVDSISDFSNKIKYFSENI